MGLYNVTLGTQLVPMENITICTISEKAVMFHFLGTLYSEYDSAWSYG